MDKNTNQLRGEKKQEQKLEALLLKRLHGDEAILHTQAGFEKIRIRVRQRIKTNKASREPVN
jgi:hypothetical protein